MSKSKTTQRKSHSHRPTGRTSAVNREKRAAQRHAKISSLWRKRLLIAAVVILCLPVLARVYVHYSVRGRVYAGIQDVPECRVAMVLGAKVHRDGSLSVSLASRVDKAIELYEAGKCERLLMSGDNRFVDYNEPERMKEYAVSRGVPAEAIALDYAGRRTYDSVYRARHIFGITRIIVVTQSFHIDRSLFLCRHVGVDAYGVPSDNAGDLRATIREIPACLGALADIYVRHPRPVLGRKETI